MTILGVDEAGRGPVMGPMVMCGFLIDEDKDLEQLDLKDSKKLSVKKREEFFKLLQTFKHKAITLTPKQIDKAVLSESMNLNRLEAKTTAQLIDHFKPDKVIIDLPEKNAQKYIDTILSFSKHKPKTMIAEHKADDTYKVVSAASIIAKVTRDKQITTINKKYGECGSGYPSDPYTQKFLKKNWNTHKELFRQSWATYQTIKKQNEQKNLLNW